MVFVFVCARKRRTAVVDLVSISCRSRYLRRKLRIYWARASSGLCRSCEQWTVFFAAFLSAVCLHFWFLRDVAS